MKTHFLRHWRTWKSKVSSQLNTNTNLPSWWPRAFTDSVFPVPAGPEIKENHDKGAISNKRTEGMKIEIFAQFWTSINQTYRTTASHKIDQLLLRIGTNIQNTAPVILTTLLQPCSQHSSNHAQYDTRPARNPAVLLKTLLQLCSQYRSNLLIYTNKPSLTYQRVSLPVFPPKPVSWSDSIDPWAVSEQVCLALQDTRIHNWT